MQAGHAATPLLLSTRPSTSQCQAHLTCFSELRTAGTATNGHHQATGSDLHRWTHSQRAVALHLSTYPVNFIKDSSSAVASALDEKSVDSARRGSGAACIDGSTGVVAVRKTEFARLGVYTPQFTPLPHPARLDSLSWLRWPSTCIAPRSSALCPVYHKAPRVHCSSPCT
jgi:hypothetical protein